MVARAVMLAVVLIGMLPGCSALSHVDKPTLGLEMRLVEDQEGQKVRPYVLLVGDGVLLASNQVIWALSAVLADGSPLYESHPDELFARSGRYNNPYYVYRAWPHVPKEPAGLVGVVDAPLWIGPELDTELLRDAKSLSIQFTIQYYCPFHSQIVSCSFDWPMTSLDAVPPIHPLDYPESP